MGFFEKFLIFFWKFFVVDEQKQEQRIGSRTVPLNRFAFGFLGCFEIKGGGWCGIKGEEILNDYFFFVWAVTPAGGLVERPFRARSGSLFGGCGTWTPGLA